MTNATIAPPADGVAELHEQSALTTSVGTPLVRRSKASNFKLSTWKWRFRIGRKTA
ncbi:MAG: hypothetical protein M3R70_08670 [Actinomycetota bacterium]|nr:hypothetical protein [Actinomycetota bacterium]